MLRVGLIGLGASVGIFLLFMLLNAANLAHFGPCGPDLLGMSLLLGSVLTGGAGAILTTVGLLLLAVEKLRH
jgi:hypothetical protein